jgi:hypothetical protein
MDYWFQEPSPFGESPIFPKDFFHPVHPVHPVKNISFHRIQAHEFDDGGGGTIELVSLGGEGCSQ